METLLAKDVSRPTLFSKGALLAPRHFESAAVNVIAPALNKVLADVFALYVKTKNFHWHVSGPHFRDYRLLLDEQAIQILAMSDPLAERVRKIGATTARSIGHIGRLQTIPDNDAVRVNSSVMLHELRQDNQTLTSALRETHALCDEYGDVATASLIEAWIDETERRVWFLSEVNASER